MGGPFPSASNRFLRTFCKSTRVLSIRPYTAWNIKAGLSVSELGRRARFFRLTVSGRKQLEVETADWSRLAGAIGKILNQEA